MPFGSGSQKIAGVITCNQVPGSEVRPVVPEECRKKRSDVLLSCLPDEIPAGHVEWRVIRWCILWLGPTFTPATEFTVLDYPMKIAVINRLAVELLDGHLCSIAHAADQKLRDRVE